MNREITNVECLLILAACLAGVVAVMGCISVETPPKVEICREFVLVTCSPEYIRTAWGPAPEQARVLAMANETSRIIYVPLSGEVDCAGRPIPDFALLGHEVLHMLRGKWHEP